MRFSTCAVLLSLIAGLLPLRAQSPLEHELKDLREQRDKAIAAAAEPINRNYRMLLQQLLRRAQGAGDEEMARKIQEELAPVGPMAQAKWFRGKWYAVVMERVSWTAARQRCEKLGGQLAVVPDKIAWEFVRSLSTANLWLGATDEEKEGEWKWIDGTPFTFHRWLKGQPNNAYNGTEHYLNTWNGSWNDAPKDGQFTGRDFVAGFVCEWKDQ